MFCMDITNNFNCTSSYNTSNPRIVVFYNAFVREGIGRVEFGYKVVVEDPTTLSGLSWKTMKRQLSSIDGRKAENANKMIKNRLAKAVNSIFLADKMVELLTDYLVGRYEEESMN